MLRNTKPTAVLDIQDVRWVATLANSKGPCTFRNTENNWLVLRGKKKNGKRTANRWYVMSFDLGNKPRRLRGVGGGTSYFRTPSQAAYAAHQNYEDRKQQFTVGNYEGRVNNLRAEIADLESEVLKLYRARKGLERRRHLVKVMKRPILLPRFRPAGVALLAGFLSLSTLFKPRRFSFQSLAIAKPVVEVAKVEKTTEANPFPHAKFAGGLAAPTQAKTGNRTVH